jgi:tetratricopeptide (TPR) repeat protein
MYGYWLRWAERSIGGPALHYGNWVGEVKHGVGSGKVAVEALMNAVRSRIIDRPLEKSAVKNTQPETPKSLTPDQFQAGMTLSESMQWHRDEYDRLASWQVEKFRKAGKYEEARELLEKIIVIVGDKPESLAASYVKLGELLQTLQEHQSASQAFRRALALEPTDRRNWYVAHHKLAVSLMEMRQYPEAEAYLRQAIRIEPEWHDAYTDLGRTLTSLEQYAEAAKLFVKATILSPYYPDALRYLEDLLDEHEVVFLQVPEIKAELEKCRQLVNRRRGVA